MEEYPGTSEGGDKAGNRQEIENTEEVYGPADSVL